MEERQKVKKKLYELIQINNEIEKKKFECYSLQINNPIKMKEQMDKCQIAISKPVSDQFELNEKRIKYLDKRMFDLSWNY